jgi:hypothetical protein
MVDIPRIKFFAQRRYRANCPNVAKAGGLQIQGDKGAAVARSTANPWQRRIWSPPAFLQGKKDGIKQVRSSSSSWVYSSKDASIRCRLNNFKIFTRYAIFFMQHRGLAISGWALI